MVDSLLKRRFLFCGGKGGVGKTTIATALALHAAESNKQTLLVSTDPAHSLSDLLEQELSAEPRLVRAGLMAMELDPDHAVDAYLAEVGQQLREYVKPALYNEVDRQLEEARQTPGASEAALLERITAIISNPPEGIDQIIFDTAPTGHTMRLMSLPETMAAWTEGLLNRRQESDQTSRVFRDLFTGQSQTSAEQRRARLAATLERRRRRFRDARTIMADPDYTGFVMVLVPERLPIEETRRAVKMLDNAGIPIAGLIVNQVLPISADGEFLKGRRQVQEHYLTKINEYFGHLSRFHLPLQQNEIRGIDNIIKLSALLKHV